MTNETQCPETVQLNSSAVIRARVFNCSNLIDQSKANPPESEINYKVWYISGTFQNIMPHSWDPWVALSINSTLNRGNR